MRMCRVARDDSTECLSDPIRCVVVDDHIMVVQLLCSTLRSAAGLDVIAVGTSSADVPRIAVHERIDLLILGVSEGNGSGFDTLRELVVHHPEAKCIILGSFLQECPADLRDNVVAFVDKKEPLIALLAAIQLAVGEQPMVGLGVPTREQLMAWLTPREVDVFECLGKGMSNKEVAADLAISVLTVETHRKAISRKLGCNGASLVRMATLYRVLMLPS